MRKYGFRDWDSVVAAIGHGGMKEGQVVNKLLEEKKKEERRKITDEEVLQAVSESKKPTAEEIQERNCGGRH